MKAGELVVYPHAAGHLACGVVIAWSFDVHGLGGRARVRTLSSTDEPPRWRECTRTVSLSTLMVWQRPSLLGTTRCARLLEEAATVLESERRAHAHSS